MRARGRRRTRERPQVVVRRAGPPPLAIARAPGVEPLATGLPLPPPGTFSNPLLTEGEFKAGLEAQLAVVAALEAGTGGLPILNNMQPLQAKNAAGVPQNLLWLDAAGSTHLKGPDSAIPYMHLRLDGQVNAMPYLGADGTTAYSDLVARNDGSAGGSNQQARLYLQARDLPQITLDRTGTAPTSWYIQPRTADSFLLIGHGAAYPENWNIALAPGTRDAWVGGALNVGGALSVAGYSTLGTGFNVRGISTIAKGSWLMWDDVNGVAVGADNVLYLGANGPSTTVQTPLTANSTLNVGTQITFGGNSWIKSSYGANLLGHLNNDYVYIAYDRHLEVCATGTTATFRGPLTAMSTMNLGGGNNFQETTGYIICHGANNGHLYFGRNATNHFNDLGGATEFHGYVTFHAGTNLPGYNNMVRFYARVTQSEPIAYYNTNSGFGAVSGRTGIGYVVLPFGYGLGSPCVVITPEPGATGVSINAVYTTQVVVNITAGTFNVMVCGY